MEFISMDLIGELYSPSKAGHKYALTVICMLTGYVFCIPLKKTKQANEVLQAYIDNYIALFLKKVIRECPSNDFRMSRSANRNRDANLQCYIYIFYKILLYYVMFVQLCLEVMSTESTNIFYSIYYGV